MKHLIYFLLFSTVVFSQNYHYAIEEAQIKLPDPPTNLIVSQITPTSVNLTWTASGANTSVSYYEIYSKNDLLVKSVGTGTTYTVTELTPETTYSLTIRTADNAGNISGDSNTVTFTTEKIPAGVNNQLEEIEYFKAYLLPLAQKANLQTAIDTYGSVRLEKGDYSGVDIVMKSNQRLYGHPTLSRVSNITVSAGSSGVILQDLFPVDKTITLQAGGVISNCTFKSIKWARIDAINAMIENNTFINILCQINFDCSTSGYFRNNKIIKHQVHSTSNQLVMKGNSTTPSYGNVHLHSNFLTPAGDATDINNVKSATFVGLDSEAWNFSGTGTKSMLYMRNIGDVKFTDLGGGNSYATVKTSAFDIDADNIFFLNKYIQSEGSSPSSKISAKTNVFYIKGEHDDYIRNSGTVTGFDFKAHFNNGSNSKDIVLNGAVQKTAIVDPAVLTKSILGSRGTPWKKPNWEILPDPLGSNWKTERTGKPDQTSYIQNLINTNGIAELPEGIFYIGTTLKLKVDGTKGIIGAGTGKTIIVGLTDDFPLISLAESAEGDNNFILSTITLQGGSVGVFAPDEMDLISYTNLKYVVFRNQNYGIQLYRIFGLDNCFFDHVSFVNCNVGFFQDPHPTYTIENSGYVDKVVFYGGQYLNCGIAVSMKATRANNLDAWVDCKFDGNDLVLDLSGHNFPIAANCDFTNNRGKYTISGEMSLYNCNFDRNSSTNATFMSKKTIVEGCTFLDNTNMFSNDTHNYAEYYIVNSKITGNVTRSLGVTQAVYINSTLSANPTLSKLLVNVKDNIPNVIIDHVPDPYPQLLISQ